MADDHPQPDKIQGYPADAEIKYLFRKTITESDMSASGGLTLVKDGPEYLYNGFPELIEHFKKGLELKLHTPNNVGLVTLKYYTTSTRRFRFLPKGWKEMATQSGFGAGKTIDCWALSSREVPLDLLIQLAPPEQQVPLAFLIQLAPPEQQPTSSQVSNNIEEDG